MSLYLKLRWLCATALIFGLFSIASQTPVEAAPTGCLPGILKQRLSQIRSKFGRVSIISTHRRGARIAGSGKRSFHASCRAVDFKPARGRHGAVVRWLKSRHGGGVGTYSCGMHHIHIDNGPRIRYHHCVTRNGTPIRYAKRHRRSRRAYRYRRGSRRFAYSRRRARRTYASRRRARSTRFAQASHRKRRLPLARRSSRRLVRTVHAAPRKTRRFQTRRYLRSVARNGA